MLTYLYRTTVKQNKSNTMTTLIQKPQPKTFKFVLFFQQWLNNFEIKQEQTARHIVRLIPAQCPFAREIRAFGKVIVRIPALCKFNPLYEELIGLRFRALCFLAEECGMDITPYCS
ncbi:MAG: hypothetical protein RLZZ69_2904 [Cyanobacteriota bacterium]